MTEISEHVATDLEVLVTLIEAAGRVRLCDIAEMVTARERRALAAAVAVASSHGLELDDPVVIYSGSNVLVHLRPAGLVARVMTGTIALHDDPRAWLEQEVAVVAFLAPSGLAVAPGRSIPPGPHYQDGLWMTFTELVSDIEPGPGEDFVAGVEDARELGRMLRALHDALRLYEGPLSGPTELRESIERLLGRLRAVDAQQRSTIVSLGRRLEELRPFVFESGLATQALHGDVSLWNLLRTRGGLVWNDFEDTFRGPVHWDLASAVGSLRIHRADGRVERAMLDAYGWGDRRELEVFLAAQGVYDEVWRIYDRQRRSSWGGADS